VLEARAAGIVPFCLTIDREAPAYAASVFGATGFAVLRDPERLPDALVGAVRQLLRG
jgi:nitric oxide reductase NorD protein